MLGTPRRDYRGAAGVTVVGTGAEFGKPSYHGTPEYIAAMHIYWHNRAPRKSGEPFYVALEYSGSLARNLIRCCELPFVKSSFRLVRKPRHAKGGQECVPAGYPHKHRHRVVRCVSLLQGKWLWKPYSRIWSRKIAISCHYQLPTPGLYK